MAACLHERSGKSVGRPSVVGGATGAWHESVHFLSVCVCYFNKYPRLRLFQDRKKSVKTLLIESRKQREALYGGGNLHRTRLILNEQVSRVDTLFSPSQLMIQVLDSFWDRHKQAAAERSF